jgi:hypothetical protein
MPVQSEEASEACGSGSSGSGTALANGMGADGRLGEPAGVLIDARRGAFFFAGDAIRWEPCRARQAAFRVDAYCLLPGLCFLLQTVAVFGWLHRVSKRPAIVHPDLLLCDVSLAIGLPVLCCATQRAGARRRRRHPPLAVGQAAGGAAAADGAGDAPRRPVLPTHSPLLPVCGALMRLGCPSAWPTASRPCSVSCCWPGASAVLSVSKRLPQRVVCPAGS